MDSHAKSYLTPQEVADLFMVSPITIRQWAQKGLLKAEVTVGGHRRFMRGEIERFAAERGLAPRRAQVPESARLLVVDDDRQLVGYIRELLSEIARLDIEVAYDGFDAGAKMQTFKPHVVLLDLMMPGLDGFEVCQRIKGNPQTRSARVIAMTAFRSPENAGRAIAAGAEQCLAKPLDAIALITLVENLIQAPAEA